MGNELILGGKATLTKNFKIELFIMLCRVALGTQLVEQRINSEV